MEIAKMLNTTILACLLILTGCLGLGDDDVIDDADADDGSTTIMNAYPPVQSIGANETITVAAGEYVEVLTLWINTTPNEYYDTLAFSTFSIDYDCLGISGSARITFAEDGDAFLPNDGTACSYEVEDYYADMGVSSLIYRVW
jgi:hypothetical protein